jgi:hypothetical protein
MTERLSDIYRDLEGSDPPVGLEEFVHRACAGEFGEVSRDDLRAFLETVEERLVRQIHEGETAHDEAAREELIDETRGWIEDLVSKYCEG